MDKIKRILITDSDYKHTLGIVRALGKNGYLIDLIGNKNSICNYSKFSNDTVYPQDKFNEQNIDVFLNFLSISQYDLILPIGAKSVELISKFKDKISSHVKVLIPDFNTIELCLNKDKTYSFFKNEDIYLPKTWYFKDLLELKNNITQINFPVVLKSKDEFEKKDPLYIYNQTELLRSFAAHYSNNNSIPLIQEYIKGDGYGFFAAYENGNCKNFFMHKRVREYPSTGGASTCAVSVYDEDLKNQGLKILNLLKWNGVAMVEFKKSDINGKFYLIEVNPKFWGSHDLALASGVNFPRNIINILENTNLQLNDLTYKVGLKFHWPFEGELYHFIENPKSLIQILKDTIDYRVKSNIWLKDFRPNLHSFYNSFNYKNIAHILIKNSELIKIYYRSKIYGYKIAIYRSFSEITGIQFNSYTKVNENIFIGCQHSHLGKFLLSINGVNCSINLRHEFNDLTRKLNFDNNYYLPIIEHTAPTISQLKDVCIYMNNEIKKGNKIFIHCSEGISRAATVLLAYFIYNGYSLDDGLLLLKSIRPFINILPEQMKILNEFSKKNTSNVYN
jgi:predicted ATP-grasp superfamily ATP-dependent carboligase